MVRRLTAWRSARIGVATVAGASLILQLLGAPPAVAQAPAADPQCDRAQVVSAWRFGGSQVHAAAQQALLGSQADVCAFLNTAWPQLRPVDDRVNVVRMVSAGGPAVKAAGQQALNSTDPAAIDTFLSSGWQQAADQDTRVPTPDMV